MIHSLPSTAYVEAFPINHSLTTVSSPLKDNDRLLPLRHLASDPRHRKSLIRLLYRVTKAERSSRGSLVDRGANGGILGNDAVIIFTHLRQVDVTGIDNHELNALKLVDASAVVETNRGPAILILRQYAYHGLDRTIHSAPQIEHNNNLVHDRSMKVGGHQCIKTHDGYVIPIDIINGLPYIKMKPNTKQQFAELPHVILTKGDSWDPRVLDNTLSDKDDWTNTLKDLDDGIINTPFDEFGNYRKRAVPEHVATDPPINTVDPPLVLLGDAPSETADAPPDSMETAVTLADSRAFRHAFHQASHLNAQCAVFDSELNDPKSHDATSRELVPAIEVKPKKVDYQKYRPYFLHVPVNKIRKTFHNTTQFATNVMSGHNILQTIQSPYPAHNVWRRNEPVASDTVFAQVPAIDTGGQTMAQVFVGRKSLVADIFGMSNEKEFINTLEDVIRKRGAMDKLITDSARVEISRQVKDILRALAIDDWQSEPNYQHQNFAEHRWKSIKRCVQWFMNWRNVDPAAWLLCLKWVADVMNHTAEESLGWRPPLEVLTGQTVDISILLCFLFWDVVYVSRYEDAHYHGQIGSTKSSEIRGRFVGFAWNVGHALTFKVLTDDTRRVICRSRLRLAKDGENNLKLDAEAGAIPQRVYIQSKRDGKEDQPLPTIDMSKSPFDIEDPVTTVKGETAPGETTKGENLEQRKVPISHSHVPQPTKQELKKGKLLDEHTPLDDPPLRDLPEVETVEEDTSVPYASNARDPDTDTLKFNTDFLNTDNPTQPGLAPEEMIDRTFLMPPAEDGSRARAKIIERIKIHKEEAAKHPDLIKFKCLVQDEYEEVVAYNDIVDFIEADETWDGVWRFDEILDHQGPLRPSDSRYKGARYNVLIRWMTGEQTWEPLHTKDKTGVYDTDPVTVALYASKHNLLKTPGWQLPGIMKRAKNQKNILRMANQAKLHSFRTKPIYMFGFLVPRHYQQAIELDKSNNNSKWQDAIDLELKQIDDYETFDDKGEGFNPGKDYKKINVHLIFSCKHDGRHKARLVAGGHLTDTPIDSVYSSVVSLRGIRILTFLGELNSSMVWATDVGNAYLESFTKELVYIKAGPEFGDREGHTLIIRKALYGLKSSGLRWSERFADVLRNMGFFPSKAEKDIWMRDKGNHYEYIAVYVDDLLILSRAPQLLIKTLEDVHKFKLKGTGDISFHLGCDFFRDKDGVLCYAPKKYIERMIDNYVRIFGQKPRFATSPLVKGDHPELDTSDLLDFEKIKIYQSLIGALQWVIQIGRFDIATAVMTMSRFRAAPRVGHMERVQRIHGYIAKMRDAVIRIRTDEPDYSNIPVKHYDWEYTCYHGAAEQLPTDAPRPLGKRVQLSHYVDANLYHDLISGRSVTGIIHLANKTYLDSFSKLQSTVETATFGSEYVAARTCTEQVIDLRNTFRYLGVPIDTPSMMFGDNESVVNTASVPHSKLHKRHNALSYHRTREAIAAGFLRFHHISGVTNPADVVSKHWDYPSVRSVLRPLLFWEGDTAEIAQWDERKKQSSSSSTVA